MKLKAALVLFVWAQLHGSVAVADSSGSGKPLPEVAIDTHGTPIPRRDRVPASVRVLGSASDTREGSRRTVHFDGNAAVAIRGSGSTIFPKHSYRLELIDEQGQDKKVSLLGMPEESDWILLASYNDKTLIRDPLAYELWREMGYYAPQARYVEVFVRTNTLDRPHPGHLAAVSSPRPRPQPEERGKSLPPSEGTNVMVDYAGVYVLVEKIKRGKERLSIRRLKPEHDREPEITGGYIFKKDRLNPSEKGFTSASGIEFAFEEPKEKDITPAQAQWLTQFVNEFERVLFGSKFRDPTNGYAKYIDVDSFVDYHWMVEMSKNVDAHWFSQFFHKDRGGKLRAGPVWDWDAAFGNAGYLLGKRTNGWRWEQVKGSYYAWYDRLFEDEEFLQRYIDRWPELRRTVFASSNLLTRIDELARDLVPAAARNYQCWYPSNDPTDTNRVPALRFQREVDRMKDWIEGRLAWIDSQSFPPPTVRITEGFDHLQRKVWLSCQVGRIFYTTAGSDPRADGGGIASTAKEYKGPITLPLGARLTARTRSEYALWSAPVRVEGNAFNN